MMAPTSTFLVLGCFLGIVLSQVLELDDRFPDMKRNHPWLIEFYAPWCGHCRRLEPIYHQVYVALRNTPIKVTKVDATRFGAIASEYDVKGFPTIKFIQGDVVYTHRGDRSKEGIIEFAKRALGPQIRPVSNLGRFRDVMGDHDNQVFFFYAGDTDEKGDLMSKYRSVAEKYAVLGYFYAGEKKVLPQTVKIANEPTVLVFKDKSYYEYDPPEGIATKSSLDDWVNRERYPAFPKVSGGALNEMSDVPKRIVMLITDEKDAQNPRHSRAKEVCELVARNYRNTLHSDYQFMWMGESETADSITMTTLTLPTLVVLDPETQFYFLPNFTSAEFTQDNVLSFLAEIKTEQAQAYGGTGFFQRLKRVFYDIWMTIYSIYETSGWLALIVFGVPTTVISIVCYALCCMEPIDENVYEGRFEDDDEDEAKPLQGKDDTDDGHVKKE